MRTVLVINTHSRQGRRSAQLTEQSIRNMKRFQVVKVIKIKRLKLLSYYLRDLQRQNNVECVIIGSGDGTISSVLNAMKRRKGIVYGFVPLGTGNAFVQSLYLPEDVDDALKVLSNGTIKKTSLGAINGHVFANVAAFGLPTRVSGNISNRTKKIFGPLAYLFSGFWHLIRHKSFLCTITYDSQERSFYTHHLVISNGRYHGHLPVSKKASVYKNQLVVTAFGTRQSRLHYAYSLLRFTLGSHESALGTELFVVKQATLTTAPKRKLEADGEIIGTTPAKIEVLPNAISVITSS